MSHLLAVLLTAYAVGLVATMATVAHRDLRAHRLAAILAPYTAATYRRPTNQNGR